MRTAARQIRTKVRCIAHLRHTPAPLLSGLDALSNVAQWGGYLYVGETSAISRYPYDPCLAASAGDRSWFPTFRVAGTRRAASRLAPDGTMYVSVGLSCNTCDESDLRRAAVLRFAADGGCSAQPDGPAQCGEVHVRKADQVLADGRAVRSGGPPRRRRSRRRSSASDTARIDVLFLCLRRQTESSANGPLRFRSASSGVRQPNP
jgi:hypothetical protein